MKITLIINFRKIKPGKRHTIGKLNPELAIQSTFIANHVVISYFRKIEIITIEYTLLDINKPIQRERESKYKTLG